MPGLCASTARHLPPHPPRPGAHHGHGIATAIQRFYSLTGAGRRQFAVDTTRCMPARRASSVDPMRSR
jgi:hypothetical protein